MASTSPVRIVLGLSLAAVLLGGAACGVELEADPVADTPAPSAAASPDAEPTMEASEPMEETVEPSADPEPSESASEEDMDMETEGNLRSEFADSVLEELSCEGGELTIDQTGSVVELTEQCDLVKVTGEGSVVLLDEVGTLDVSATGAVVIVKEADAITVSGTGNAVTYETGSPKVTDSGSANAVLMVDE